MEALKEYLPFILPIIIVQYGLVIISLLHLWRHRTVRLGNKLIWVLVIVLVGYIGPILYFTIGKGEE